MHAQMGDNKPVGFFYPVFTYVLITLCTWIEWEDALTWNKASLLCHIDQCFEGSQQVKVTCLQQSVQKYLRHMREQPRKNP